MLSSFLDRARSAQVSIIVQLIQLYSNLGIK